MTTSTDSSRRLLRLTRLLGRGGFGEVYEGEIRTSTGLTRRVAVKRLRKDLADGDDALLRLRDEASLLSQLRHPVVVSVEDLIPLDGHMTLISEYVEGVDLSAACPMPPRAALEAVSKVAQALAAAWGQRGPSGEPLRIVHRDIKPANIRLGPHGVVKLLDFGIARTDTVTRAAKTGTGLMVGSMGYMAPERWKGEPDAHAGDIFALGCVLFEALSGEQFFGGMSAAAQVGLAVDASRYKTFLDDRLTALPSQARSTERLLRAMLAHNPPDRPTGVEVADRALSLAGRVRGDSLLAWSRALDELPAPSDENRVDSSWIEGPSGFSRVSPTSDSGVATLEHVRPGQSATGTTVKARRPAAVGIAAGVGGLLLLGIGAVVALVAAVGIALYLGVVPGMNADPGGVAALADERAASDPGASGVADHDGSTDAASAVGGAVASQGVAGASDDVGGDASSGAGPSTASGASRGDTTVAGGTSSSGAGATGSAPSVDQAAVGSGTSGGTSSSVAGTAGTATSAGQHTAGTSTSGGDVSGSSGAGSASSTQGTSAGGSSAGATTPGEGGSSSSGASSPNTGGASSPSAGGTSSSGDSGGATGGVTGSTTSGASTTAAPSPPAAASTASILVQGHRTVRLKGPTGLLPPGAVPPGTYTVQVSFDAGVWTDALTLTAKAGDTLTVRCDARFRQCRKVNP